MRPVELIPESINVTNNGPEDLRFPGGVVVAKGATVTVKLFQFAGGPSAGPGRNSTGTSLEPAALDSQSQTYSYVGAADPGPTAGIPIGGGAPRSTANAAGTGDSTAGAISGPAHIEGDSPRQKLWNAIAAASYDGLATLKYVSAATLVAGGTGYTANDILTVVGGTYTSPAKIKVLTVTLGVVTTYEINQAGTYSVLPTGTVATTGGTGGADATFTLTTVDKIITLSNQVVGSNQANIAVGGGTYYGTGLDLDTPQAKRTVSDDSSAVRTINGTYKFNTAPKGGAAITSVRAR